jgi:putative ABC transport system permease protein
MRRTPSPPRLACWLLQCIYDEELVDEISGDLLELYHERLANNNKWQADLLYCKDVLLSVRNISLKRNRVTYSSNSLHMIKNMISISFRSLKKRSAYTLLNIVGLSVSMTFAFLLWLYVQYQNSFDKNYSSADNIYRINLDCNMNGKRDVYCNVPQPVAGVMKNEYPEIKESLRVAMNDHEGLLEYEGRKFKSERLLIAGPAFFKFFNREFKQGNVPQCLSQPNSIVISEPLAIKIFGSPDALGKIVQFPEEKKSLTVTGVIRDDAHPTHMPFEAVISWNTFPDRELDWWYGGHAYTYLLLREGSSIKNLERKMPAFFQRYMKKAFDGFSGTGRLFFQPLTSIYLSDELVWEPYPHGNRLQVMALSWVGFFLIVFAGINYVNLSTARAAERAKEVGIRKVLGSSKLYLRLQFLSESILLCLISAALVCILSILLMPAFNTLSGLHFPAYSIFTLHNSMQVLLLALGLGLTAGAFPSFYLSSLQPVKVLKGKFVNGLQGETLRKVLVTSQYFMVSLLISGILLVYEQTSFIKTKDIGFRKENLLDIRLPGDSLATARYPIFVKQLKLQTAILSTTITSTDLHKDANSGTPTFQNEDGSTFQMGVDLIRIDPDFLETIGATLLTGRSFNKNSKSDLEQSILINEAAMLKFGWGKNPLGGKFAAFTPREPSLKNVIGVVKDFRLGVSYRRVHPTVIFMSGGTGSNLYLRISPGRIPAALSLVEDIWKKTFPGYAFEYSFVDQNLNSLYRNEEKFMSLLTVICVIVLIIASIGVIGLISYTTILKKKEIAIRKVLGSSIKNIVRILSGKFMWLMLLANVLAFPVSWYLNEWWLRNFDERVTLHGGPFLISVVVCFLFTALSLLYHTLHAAMANPVESLKYE